MAAIALEGDIKRYDGTSRTRNESLQPAHLDRLGQRLRDSPRGMRFAGLRPK